MKRICAIVLSLVMFSMLAACPPPNPNTPAAKYQPGFTTVLVAQAVVKTGYSTFLGVESALHESCDDKVCVKLHPDKTGAPYKECMAQDHSAVAEWKTCYGKMAQAKPIVDKAVPLALSVLSEAKAALEFAVQYETVKEAAEAAKDPKTLQAFCVSAFPEKTGDQYTKCLAGQPLAKADWQALLIKGSCVVYNALAFVPVEYAKYTELVRIWFKAYGSCK